MATEGKVKGAPFAEVLRGAIFAGAVMCRTNVEERRNYQGTWAAASSAKQFLPAV